MGVGDWLRRLFSRPPSLPERWTDDMTVPLPPGRTAAEVVELVIQAALAGTPDAETERQLTTEFVLSADDAALARDRTFGGIVRAGTRNQKNCPQREKDPMAWESFQRAWRDPSIFARIYPDGIKESGMMREGKED